MWPLTTASRIFHRIRRDLPPSHAFIFYHTTDMEEARKRLKVEYEKAVAYAKEIGFTESDESELQTWVSQDDGSYEIYAGDSFSETGKIYEAERA